MMQHRQIFTIFHYTQCILDQYKAHIFQTQIKSTMFLWKNKNLFIWNTLRTFEGMPLSLPDIETILNGNSVLGLSLNDMLKVKSYNKAVKELYLNI